MQPKFLPLLDRLSVDGLLSVYGVRLHGESAAVQSEQVYFLQSCSRPVAHESCRASALHLRGNVDQKGSSFMVPRPSHIVALPPFKCRVLLSLLTTTPLKHTPMTRCDV